MSRLPAPENPVVNGPVLHTSSDYDFGHASDAVYYADSKGDLNSDSHIPVKRRRKAPLLVSSISKDEPIVSRRELWSYYCG